MSIVRIGVLFKFTKLYFSLKSGLSMTETTKIQTNGILDPQTLPSKRTFYIKTFGCQMNYADSEKIHRVLMQAGCLKVLDPILADIVIINTCSVRQKGEDKVFGFIREIRKARAGVQIGITGCMTRKTGMAKRYIECFQPSESTGVPRENTKKITLLGISGNLWNWDDELFLRSDDIDFVFRIEETGHLTKILSLIYNEDFGNDEKWEEYLKIHQVPLNTSSANIIIQTGCDNYCTFCIVPYTRGREISRPLAEIIEEVQAAVLAGAKEITLLRQNVNSYGKLNRAKLWNTEDLKWNDTAGEPTPFRELLNGLSGIE